MAENKENNEDFRKMLDKYKLNNNSSINNYSALQGKYNNKYFSLNPKDLAAFAKKLHESRKEKDRKLAEEFADEMDRELKQFYDARDAYADCT